MAVTNSGGMIYANSPTIPLTLTNFTSNPGSGLVKVADGASMNIVTAFSNAPLRWCAYIGAGMLVLALALAVAGVALLPELGGGILLVLAVLFGVSGVQMLALATVGEYVWSALAEARRRPQYVIEVSTAETGHLAGTVNTVK